MSTAITVLFEPDSPVVDRRRAFGDRGERLAADFLVAHEYRLVVANFKVPVGRNARGVQVTGEIDIIAIDDDDLCFVEVKSRSSEDFAPATANVDIRKQRQITRTARVYRRIFNIREMHYRFDVVTVVMPKYADPRIQLIKGFWSESKFQKRNWSDGTWDEFG